MIRSGLIGRSILASRSPWLHEQEAQAQGVELRYHLFDFAARGLEDAALAPLLADLLRQGYAGVNVTYPFKQAVMPLLDEIAESASIVGAVNTVAMHGGRTIGHNTDMSGFRDSLRDGLPGADLSRVLQLGAGGAGAAVASALLGLGTGRLEVCDLNAPRTTALVERLCARFGEGRAVARAPCDKSSAGITGVVNTTPIGMAAAPGSPIAPEQLRPDLWVADIVYFPIETELLREARARGCRTLDGSGMVIGQAATAFEIITGHLADKERMRASFALSRP